MGLFGKKYKTDASGNKVRIADKGYEKEYLKKTKKYISDMTGKESKATTSAEARKEAGQTPGSKKPVAKWQGYDQDTRVEVPTKRSFKEKRNIFGGKAGKAKNKKPKGDTKLVRVKNEKQAAKAHKRRAEAGLTKEFSIPKGKAENYPMSEEDKNYILTGKGRPSSKDIKAKISAKTAGKKPEVKTEENTEEVEEQSTSRRRVPLTAAAKKKKKEKQRAAEEKKRLKDILKAEKQKSLKKKAAALDDQWSL